MWGGNVSEAIAIINGKTIFNGVFNRQLIRLDRVSVFEVFGVEICSLKAAHHFIYCCIIVLLRGKVVFKELK